MKKNIITSEEKLVPVLSLNSEVIAVSAFEKIYSYVMTEIDRKQFNELTSVFCYDYTERFLSNTLQTHFIFYDQITRPYNDSSCHYSNQYYGHDDWEEINEPPVSEIDRYACTTIGIHRTRDLSELWEETNEENTSKIINIEPEIKNSPSPKKSASKFQIKSTKTIRPKNNPEEAQIELNRKDLFEDDNDIIQVRLAKFEEWKRQEDEIKKKQKGEREFLERAAEALKRNKEYGGKQVTADSNGNPIYIKPTAPEKLLSDFLFSRSVIAEKKPIDKDLITTERNEEKKKTKQAEEKKGKDTKIKGVTDSVKDQKGKSPTEKPQRDGRKKPTHLHSENNDNRISLSSPKVYQPTQVIFMQPMGSNYDAFIPDVGVTLYEGNRTKTGGKDFKSIFKKPSKYDYLSIVKDAVKTSYGNKTNFDEMQESRLTSRRDSTKKLTNLPKIALNKNKDRIVLQGSFNETMTLGKKLTTSLKTALDKLDYMPEYEEQLTDQKFKNSNRDIFKSTKFFENPKSESIRENQENLEEINQFNLSILKSQTWGKDTSALAAHTKSKSIDFINKHPVKPNRKIFEKELGSKIVNVKLPRARMYSYLTNTNEFHKHNDHSNVSASVHLPALIK